MERSARVVVVGGGCVGVGVLYGLAKRGWSDCLLLERRTLGSASTRMAGGFIPTYVRHHVLSPLINKTTEIYAGLEAETGLSAGMHHNGQMRIARSRERLDEYWSYMNAAQAIGANARLLTPQETRELWPLMRDTNGVFGALYHPDDAYVGPTDVTMAMAKGARDCGARIAQNTQVLGFERKPGGEWKVSTTQGDVLCEHVVLATGNYARQTGAMLGLNVPAQPIVVQYWFTDAIPEIVERKRLGLSEMPIVRDEAYLGYTREEGDGLMFGAYERPEALELFGVDGIPGTYDGDLLPANLDGHAEALEIACDLVPALGRAGLKSNIRGPMQMTEDGLPLVGPARGLDGIWLAEGVPGGILWGGAIGHSLSEWIVEGEASVDMTALDSRRFGDHATRSWTRLKAVETWGSHSDCIIPGTEMPAGRPAKTAPSYDRLDGLGAMWGVRNGWETPNWYAPAGVPRDDSMTYRHSASGPHIAAEVAAVRSGVGLSELTCLAKFEVDGPDAAAILDAMLATRLPAQGRWEEALLLFEAGGVKMHFAVARLAKDRFYLVAPAQAEAVLEDELRRLMPPGATARLRNVSMERGVFLLSGPAARDLLGTICGQAVSPAAMPWGSAHSLEVGPAPDVRVLRNSPTGELSFELHHPMAYQRALLDLLLDVGKPFGLRLVGTRALGSLRLDTATPLWPADAAADISAVEGGFLDLVDFEKPAFPGRAAVLAERGRKPRRRLVPVVLDADGFCPMGEEGLYADDKLAGRMTSAGWSFHFGRPIGLAIVDDACAGAGTRLRVPVLDGWLDAVVAGESPYDPARQRARAG